MANIETSLDIWKCPICNEASSIDSWDNATLSRCNNRFARRNFKSLGLEHNTCSGTRRWYVCPVCGKSTVGDKIRTGVRLNGQV